MPPLELASKRELLSAFRRGDVLSMLTQLGLSAAAPEYRDGIRALAELAIAVRRESVFTLGSHEAFVRRTPSGDLRQVIQGVRLSLADKTLYQIPIRRPHTLDGEEIGNLDAWKKANSNTRYTWKEIPQASAEVTYQGYLRQNAVAGCAVGSPPTVIVDGEPKTNPYFQRAIGANGRPGDIVRVVIAVVVVGPAPATGNPVAVNYVLDYDPSKDLLHMLGECADKHPDDCYLIDESQVEAELATRATTPGQAAGDPNKPSRARASWTFVPLYGGVGYLVNLRVDAVRAAYAKFTGILQDAQKKAQTVARRNAMRAHPALATHTVTLDGTGSAVVGVTGWAMDQTAMARWLRIQERIARGGELGADVETISLVEAYDAEKHAVGPDPEPDSRPIETTATEMTGVTEMQEINAMIEHIDTALQFLSPSQAQQVHDLGYADPSKLTLQQLKAIAVDVNRFMEIR